MTSSYVVSDQSIFILLIEDNPADTRLMQELLPPDHRIEIASHLAEGLAYLEREQPDVILLDLYLPDSQGVDTVRRLRANIPNVAVIVMTRFDDENTGAQAIHNGAQDYLIKGQIDSRTLQRSIRYALERQRSAAALRESEQRFRVMFEQAAVGMAITNLDGYFQFVNQRLGEILGYSTQDMLGMTIADITHEDDLGIDWANINRLLAGEQPSYTMEKRYVRSDGQIIWGNLTRTLVRAEHGEPSYFLAVIQDITERKKAEETRARLAAIIESSEDGIISKTPEGIITSWNAGAERIYGYTAEEVIGQPLAQIIPPEYENEHHQIMAQIRRGESVSGFETKRLRKDGKLIDISLTVSPIRDAAGQIVGVSSIKRDITTLKWAQAARSESEQRLRQLTDNLDEVLWLQDTRTGQLLYVSAAFATMWGITRDLLYEQPYSFIEHIHPADRDRVLEALRRHAEGGFDEEYRIVHPGGTTRWVRARTSPIRNEAGEVYRIAGIAEDTTDYKQLVLAEQEQRALAEALRSTANALNSTVDMTEIMDRLLTNISRVVQHDAAEIILIEGEKAKVARSYGYDSRGLQAELEAIEFVVTKTPNLFYMAQNKKPLIIPDIDEVGENEIFIRSPALFWRSYAGVPIYTQGEVIGFINLGSLTPYFFTPVHADRLQAFAEQVAIAIQNARLHEDTRQLAAHHERQRLARDLHDAVSQTLFAATITTEALLKQYEQNPTRIGPRLAELHKLTRGALAETRAVLLELRPESLAEIGFRSLIEQLVEAVQSRRRLQITVELDPADDLEPDLKLVLYRITQEALNNIVKHAQASQVAVRLLRDEIRLVLAISDDGIGFDTTELPPTSMGLSIMHERAASVDAIIEVESKLGQGTRITVLWKNYMRKVNS